MSTPRAGQFRIAVCSVVVDGAAAPAVVRLVRSLRWFGGACAAAPIVIVALQPLDAETTRVFTAAGVTVRFAESEWRPAMAEAVAALAVDQAVLVGSDALILQDPSPAVAERVLHVMRAAAPATVSPERRRRIAALCGLGETDFPNYDPGVLAAPPAALAALLTRWLECSRAIWQAAVLGEQEPWRDALTFSAVVAQSDRYVELPPTFGHAAHAPLPDAWDPTSDPLVLRAASADDAGRIGYTPYPFVQARIERLNRRLAGHARQQPVATGCSGRPPAQVVVLGMHRSGTSLLAGLLALTGLHAGAEDDFPPADEHNRKGYWELLDVWAIDEALLALAGGSWDEPSTWNPETIREPARTRLAERARGVIARLDRRGPWLVKDPRLSLLLPFWRPWLSHPVAVLVYRDPLAVARSLAARDGFALERGMALWERYNREALAASEGMPRVIVAQRDLVANPRAIMERVVAALAAAGVEGLAVPDATALAGQVEPALVHHHGGAGAAAGPVPTAAQAELLARLERERVDVIC
jgi:sulfotransferase family protein